MIVVIVAEDTVGIALRIIELTLAQHPPEGRKTDAAQKQADGNKNAKDFHYRNLSALSDTVKDELDIASAAISGEHRPATASGTASKL